MKNYKFSRFSSIIILILAILWTLGRNPLGPIFLALNIPFITFDLFKNKLNKTVSSIIMAAILAAMILGEYFWVHLHTAIFYVPIATLSIGIWVLFYVSLIPKDQLTQRVKNLFRISIILLMVSPLALLILIYNNFIVTLATCAVLLIITSIILLMRRGISRADALKDEFNGVSTTRNPEKYWFRYKIGGIPRPASWQGWICYIISFLSPFIILISGRRIPIIILIIIFIAFPLIGMAIAMLKSNYRESIREYRENLRKKYDDI